MKQYKPINIYPHKYNETWLGDMSVFQLKKLKLCKNITCYETFFQYVYDIEMTSDDLQINLRSIWNILKQVLLDYLSGCHI